MDKQAVFLGFISVLALVSCQYDKDEGPCFHFPGGTFLEFSPKGFDNNKGVHYRLKFRTNKDKGVILYSHGLSGDEESLHILYGHLHYAISIERNGFNYGGHYRSEEAVNTGEWVTVDLYRHWKMNTSIPGLYRLHTGMKVKVGNGKSVGETSSGRRDMVSLPSTIYIGGFTDLPYVQYQQVGYFEGDIKDIREMKNAIVFEEPSINFAGMVERFCLEGTDIV